MKPIEAFLSVTVACAVLLGGCSFGKEKKRDSKKDPQPEVISPEVISPESKFPVTFVNLSQEDLTILECEEDGVNCNDSAAAVVSTDEALSSYEVRLGIAALKVSQELLRKDLSSNGERRTELSSENIKADAAPARILNIDPQLDILNVTVADLEGNIAEIDRQLVGNPISNALRAQRLADLATLDNKRAQRTQLTSEKNSLIELLSGNGARDAELEALLAADQIKIKEFNQGSKLLAEKLVAHATGTQILAALPRNVNIKMSELETQLPWLKEVIATLGEKK